MRFQYQYLGSSGSIVVDFPYMGAACCFSSLESLLRDSTSRFLAAVSAAPDPDLTNFRSLFSWVLNTYPDPPLEAVWFFSVLSFHDAPDDLRNLLHLLSAFTASSRSVAKQLALLAPVVSKLFHSAKPRREAEVLVEAVLSYISICSSRGPAGGEGASADTGSLLPAFGELVKVPIPGALPSGRGGRRRELIREGCSVAFLAGVVVAEAFLLRLCLKVQGAAGVPRAELQKELRIWAVSSISVFQNQQFFDLEDKGFRVFGENVSRVRERLMYDEVKNGYQSMMIHSDADLFFIDKQSGWEVMDTRAGEDEEAVEMETADNAFMAAAQSMKVMTNGMRKRKDCGNEDANVVKFVKYKVEDSSVKDYFLSANNGMSSGSEVENPQSDDEMEEND
ncbi:hypothetical protein E2562_033618 [Oryza meyeriana var. granulata]|uniref:Uncharacterized protein n=1 Tax=Oryza meyeriana var. granulata TaxID=110450 RepID=A0A6G1FEW1_9ORYZ|nr:hypothetical protein E2562_033618 [Oryza meyeriana var. granulata]